MKAILSRARNGSDGVELRRKSISQRFQSEVSDKASDKGTDCGFWRQSSGFWGAFEHRLRHILLR